MSTKARKRNARIPKKQNASLRKDVREAIDRVWPAGVIELSFDSDESYFYAVHPKLSRAFRRLPSAQLLHEREAEGGPIWWDESDPEEDPPDDVERSRSYPMFFVSPEGEPFTFATETEGIAEPEFMTGEVEEADWREDPPVSRIPARQDWLGGGGISVCTFCGRRARRCIDV